jgi:hypothetical protein
VNRVMPSSGPANRPRSTCDLGWKGTPNGGSGGLGSDDPIDLGGDGYIGRYCEGGIVVLGPLLRGCRRHRHEGARRGGALFPVRSCQIKWRIEARIVLVRTYVAFTQRLEH